MFELWLAPFRAAVVPVGHTRKPHSAWRMVGLYETAQQALSAIPAMGIRNEPATCAEGCGAPVDWEGGVCEAHRQATLF